MNYHSLFVAFVALLIAAVCFVTPRNYNTDRNGAGLLLTSVGTVLVILAGVILLIR